MCTNTRYHRGNKVPACWGLLPRLSVGLGLLGHTQTAPMQTMQTMSTSQKVQENAEDAEDADWHVFSFSGTACLPIVCLLCCLAAKRAGALDSAYAPRLTDRTFGDASWRCWFFSNEKCSGRPSFLE